MTSHSPASSPELPKLPDLLLAYYASDHVRAYATAHGLACYEAGRASHAAPTVPVDAVVGEPVAMPCMFHEIPERVSRPHVVPHYTRGHQVRCPFCGAFGPTADDEAGAIAAWNRRTPSLVVSPPHPGGVEISALLDSILAEYNWPTNPKNAARAGWTAARRYLAASMASRAQTEWQPIETAPKNPIRRVLLRWLSGKSEWICIGAWASAEDSPRLKVAGCPREGWMPDAGTCIPINQKDCIGWQPLPSAPATPGETK